MKTNHLYLITALLLLVFCGWASAPHHEQNTVPSAVEDYWAGLHPHDQPVKSAFNDKHIIWLSAVGELHLIGHDTSNHVSFKSTGERWEEVTFIEDFYLCPDGDRIFFTDIMDLATGQSAIKVVNLQNHEVQVVCYLGQAIPYSVRFVPKNDWLFFLTKTDQQGIAHYDLQFFHLGNNRRGTLYSSSQKMDQLAMDNESQQICVQQDLDSFLSFSVEPLISEGLAEAKQ